MATLNRAEGTLVVVGQHNGLTVIPAPTPLTRLNYFDGKFLRAEDLQREQQYLRSLVHLSNQAGGPGVVHGFDVTPGGGDQLVLGPGLAIDPGGRVLLLPQSSSVSIAELLDASRQQAARSPAGGGARLAGNGFADCTVEAASPPSRVARGSDLYLITIAHAEALCGEEDVYGRLCEEACITSSDRPFRLEGLVLRAIPLTLQTPLATSGTVALDRRHLRSLVASAYFTDERNQVGSLISRAGLQLDTWCRGALPAGGSDVPLGVLARAGSTTVFLDAWIARRERIETPPRRYWAWRMRMRPWDVFLAHVLQFQCQLHEVLRGSPEPGGDDDPCRDQRDVLDQASAYLAEVEQVYARHVSSLPQATLAANLPRFELPGGTARIATLRTQVVTSLQGIFAGPLDRVLIRGGIVELPSAGYLPVVPGSGMTVNTQVRRLLGEGVDLRFCVVRPDFVAHALEEAQHMDRISLLQGLDNPERRPEVDVLVPDGEIIGVSRPQGVRGWEVRIAPPSIEVDADRPPPGTHVPATQPTASLRMSPSEIVIHGAGRSELLQSGGAAFHFAGAAPITGFAAIGRAAREMAGMRAEEFDIAEAVRRTARAAAADEDTPSAEAETRTASNDPLFSRQPDEIASLERRQTALAAWASLECAANPFTLANGARTAVNGRVAIAVSGQQSAFTDVRLSGYLVVDEPGLVSGSAGRVMGRFSGDAILRTGGGSQPVQSQVEPLHTPVILQRTHAPDGAPALEITVTLMQRITVTLTTSWRGEPIRARSVLRVQIGTSVAEHAVGTADEDASVLLPGNPVHGTATEAIRVLDAALAPVEPGFGADATRLLFPPPPTRQEGLIVRATQDWVLFHRRRTKRCGEEVVRPPLPVKRFLVFHVLADSEEQVRAIRQQLLQGRDLGEIGVEATQVSVVEFAGATANLNTPVGAILQDWAGVDRGDSLAYAAIGNLRPDPLEESLARPRLDRMRSTLSGLWTEAAGLPVDVVPVPTPREIPPGLDGAMLFATVGRVQTTCHRVFALPDQGMMDFILDSVIPGGRLQRDLESYIALGTVRFQGETTNAVGGSLETMAQAWRQHDFLASLDVARALVVVSAQAPPRPSLGQQAQVIAASLGGTLTDGERPSRESLFEECPAIVLLEPGQRSAPPQLRTGRLVSVRVNPASGQRTIASSPPEIRVTFAANGTLQGGLPANVLSWLREIAPNGFSQMQFATSETTPDAAARDTRMNNLFTAIRNAGIFIAASGPSATQLTTAERSLLNAAGTQVDDVVFMQPQ